MSNLNAFFRDGETTGETKMRASYGLSLFDDGSQRRITTKGRFQYTIGFILTVTGMVGITVALLRYFSPYLVLPVLVFPLAIAVEVLTTGIGTQAKISHWSQWKRLSVVALLSAFLAVLSYWSLSAGYPTVVRPLPFLSIIPAMFGIPMTIIVGAQAFAFAATIAPSIWLQRTGLPVRFHFVLAASTIATVYWFIMGWEYANKYQSREYAVGVTVVNLLALCGLWVGLWFLRNSQSFSLTLGFATALFAWLYAFAFPWMGELL